VAHIFADSSIEKEYLAPKPMDTRIRYINMHDMIVANQYYDLFLERIIIE